VSLHCTGSSQPLWAGQHHTNMGLHSSCARPYVSCCLLWGLRVLLLVRVGKGLQVAGSQVHGVYRRKQMACGAVTVLQPFSWRATSTYATTAHAVRA
jgi:hypothetical protein